MHGQRQTRDGKWVHRCLSLNRAPNSIIEGAKKRRSGTANGRQQPLFKRSLGRDLGAAAHVVLLNNALAMERHRPQSSRH